ncbi:MAG: ferric reductase-like transmembrane domain-containing protein [Anaerolineaceae bacterium]|nr:ferric reductase-like transmembrane domain-containing protein [Anaerolineaceae bacterium]
MNQESESDNNILGQVIWLFLGVLGGIGAAYYFLPQVMPSISASLSGVDVKAYWYLSRGSAIIAYVLLWLSMLMGLLLSSKLSKTWPGTAKANDIHKFISLLGLFFVIFHALILMGDVYLAANFWQLFIPLSGFPYRPEWVLWGQVGLFLWIGLILSSYARKRIGRKAWRVLHFGSFLMFIFALIHGIGSGTDTALPAMQILYWISAGSIVFLILFRIITAILPEPAANSTQQKIPLNEGV